MSINIELPKKTVLKATIAVFGVGGAGGNAVNNMINSNLEGVNFYVANTDAQALEISRAEKRIHLGQMLTQGLGAGSYPEVGRAAAEESLDELREYMQGCNMVFITAGMGGGTGTGAAPVIARLAKEMGVLTVSVVTKPFHFEGSHRMRVADLGVQELQKFVDTLIVIPNQNLFRIADKNTTFADAFKMADDVLHAGVRSVTDLMVMPGLINLDFADVRSVISEMGKAMMGTGEASGENRALEAAEAAISNPLLDNASMHGAKGVLINITGGPDMTLFEVDEAANRIREEVDSEANIIFGSTFNQALEGKIRVSVVATGIDGGAERKAVPTNNFYSESKIKPKPVENEFSIDSFIAPEPTEPELTAKDLIADFPELPEREYAGEAAEENMFYPVQPQAVAAASPSVYAKKEPVFESNNVTNTGARAELAKQEIAPRFSFFGRTKREENSNPLVEKDIRVKESRGHPGQDQSDIPAYMRKKN